MRNSMVETAVKLAGGSSKLARAVGVRPPTVQQWLCGDRPVPGGRCIAIEMATGGEITRYELRPDIFGSSPDQAA